MKHLMARSSLAPCDFVWEKNKAISETIVVKVGRQSKLNEFVNLYEYQKPRSFIDLGPSSLRFNIFKFFSLETAGPPYTVKNLNKSLFGTKRPITLKLAMQYWLIDYCQIYSNDDTGMTLTYFTAKSYLFPYTFVWEKDKNNMFVYDIKVGRCSQSNEYMKHYEL